MVFRSDKKPVGPKFSNSKEVAFDFSGTKLRFLKPPGNGPKLQVEGKSIFPTYCDNRVYNIYDNSIYKSDNEIRSGLEFAFEIYDFKGTPLLRNNIGSLEFSARIRKHKYLKNILNSRNYEAIIDKELTSEYGPQKISQNRWTMNFPLFWHSFKLPGALDNRWVCYAVQDMAATRSESISYFVRTPITSEHDITFCFHGLELHYESGSFELFREICLFILNSIHLETSPSIQEEFRDFGLPKKFDISKSKPSCRFENANRLSRYKYELVDDPNFFYKKNNKLVDRYFIK